MFDFRNFDDIFEFDTAYAYDQKDAEDIETCRKQLEGLFLDKVLKLLGIKRAAKIYPPRTNANLRELHQLVVDSNGAEHAKYSVLYYVLLDTGSDDQVADKFAERVVLPKKNQIFMQGLWHMDRREFELALQYLTHPSLLPTFNEEILEALINGAAKNDYTLALAYYHTVSPTISSSRTMDALFMAMAQTSVSESFFFARSQAESTHQYFFQSLISHIMREPANERTANKAVELINLPFSADEEGWFEAYLTIGGGRQFKKAKDTVLMRKIAKGQYSEARNLTGMDGRPANGLNWEKIQSGLENGLGPRLI